MSMLFVVVRLSQFHCVDRSFEGITHRYNPSDMASIGKSIMGNTTSALRRMGDALPLQTLVTKLAPN